MFHSRFQRTDQPILSSLQCGIGVFVPDFWLTHDQCSIDGSKNDELDGKTVQLKTVASVNQRFS